MSARVEMRIMPLVFGFLVAVVGCSDDNPAEPSGSCADRAVFGAAANSEYILPFQVGESYTISQSYCQPLTGHSNQLAYDFEMPIGDDIVAARAGVVRMERDDVPDDGDGTDPTYHNNIYIEHDDGSVAFYAHLQQNSVVVQVGDTVVVGQRIAASGNSGNTGGLPHLHFGVYQDWPPQEGEDVAINFRNADGPLDSRGGLEVGATYTALQY
jgi:murein DD-endopeptidase MepM/ murein hydrolase activator NlpD